MPRSTTTDTKRKSAVRSTILATALAAGGVLVSTAALETPTVAAAEIPDHDWLGVLNAYRAQSGLAPVVEDAGWSAGARNHSCWMLLNGAAHDEAPGTPGYTSSGDSAGNNGNVAVSASPTASARYFIDLWMSAPFHAVGVLRSRLQSTGFGLCASPPHPSNTPWKTASTLDVLRGTAWHLPKHNTPIVFPGNGATTRMTRFIAESPDPRTYCGWSGRVVGLPLIAMLPAGVSTASATLTGPGGPIGTCVLHAGNTDGVAKSILGGDNAVVIVPAAQLQTGAHSVSVTSNGGNVSWSFNVDPNARLTDGAPAEPAELRDTVTLSDPAKLTTVTRFRFADSRIGQTFNRLPARTPIRFRVAGVQGIPVGTTAISANFTVAGPSGSGYLTASDCSGAATDVSTLNYAAGDVVANQSLVPLAPNGDLCLFSHEATDVLIDINGFVAPSGDSTFNAVTPTRLVDTRGSTPLRPDTVRTFRVTGAGTPVPSTATAVVVNVTAVDPQTDGWLRVFPCDAPEPNSSTLNVWRAGTRANTTIARTSATGTICVRSTATTHILVDVTGWVGPKDGYRFTPLRPMRTSDTRSRHPQLNPGADGQPLRPGVALRIPIAGSRGIPASAKAATLNVTATGSVETGYLKVTPCDAVSNVSTVNYPRGGTVANGTTVKLGGADDVCIWTSQTTHVIVDITGVWT